MTLQDTPSPSAELGVTIDAPAAGDLYQLRRDTWTRLRTLCGQLATTTRRGNAADLRQNLFELTRPTRLSKGAIVDPTDLRGRIRKALETLRSFESYFAFPGAHAIDELGSSTSRTTTRRSRRASPSSSTRSRTVPIARGPCRTSRSSSSILSATRRHSSLPCKRCAAMAIASCTTSFAF